MKSSWLRVDPMTSVLKREDRKRGEDRHSQGHGKMEAESGDILPQEPREDERGGRTLPESLWREYGSGTS